MSNVTHGNRGTTPSKSKTPFSKALRTAMDDAWIDLYESQSDYMTAVQIVLQLDKSEDLRNEHLALYTKCQIVIKKGEERLASRARVCQGFQSIVSGIAWLCDVAFTLVRTAYKDVQAKRRAAQARRDREAGKPRKKHVASVKLQELRQQGIAVPEDVGSDDAPQLSEQVTEVVEATPLVDLTKHVNVGT